MSAAGDSRTLTAVVAALPEELRPLRAALAQAEERRLGDRVVTFGRIGSSPVVVAASGDGDRNARAATADLLGMLEGRLGRLLVVGVAGALSPGLPVGALVLAGDVFSSAGTRLTAPPSLARWAAHACGAVRGRVVTAGAIADTVAVKAELGARFGAADGAPGADPVVPSVVDLESFGCAAVAAAAGLPWLVLRAVSDTASEALPGLLNRCRDDGGAIRRGRVARALLREPRALPTLLALRRRVAFGARALVPAIRSLLDAWLALDEGVPAPRTRNREELHE